MSISQFLDTLRNSSKFSESRESGGVFSILTAKNIVSNRRNMLNTWALKHSPPSVHLALLWKSLNYRNSPGKSGVGGGESTFLVLVFVGLLGWQNETCWRNSTSVRVCDSEEHIWLHIRSIPFPVLSPDSAPFVKECCLEPKIYRIARSQGSKLWESSHIEIKNCRTKNNICFTGGFTGTSQPDLHGQP